MKARLSLALALLLAACSSPAPEPRSVDPQDYADFFLWSGVRPPHYLSEAESVYLLWGEVRRNDPENILPLRRAVPQDPGPDLWLVVRADRLDWGEGAYEQLFAQIVRWQAAGNPVVGIQVDFDSATLKLGTYAGFLKDLRGRMPHALKLSATGLMDWTNGAIDADLAELAGVLDEIVVQTYQGRTTVPGYEAYLPSLERLPLPYRVGLVEGGEWQAPESLSDDPEFLGYVVFLLPE